MLSRQALIDTALRLADERGIDALSMPALARELHCGTMTLYDYVENKADLLDSVAQRGLEGLRLERPITASAAGVLEAWGRALRKRLLEHPALPGLFLVRAVVGKGILRGVEALLGALAREGMDPADGVRAIYAVLIYTTGFVAWEIPRTHRQAPAVYQGSWRRLFAEIVPGSTPLAESVQRELGEVAGGRQFEAGLVALSTGLTLPPMLPERRKQSPRSAR